MKKKKKRPLVGAYENKPILPVNILNLVNFLSNYGQSLETELGPVSTWPKFLFHCVLPLQKTGRHESGLQCMKFQNMPSNNMLLLESIQMEVLHFLLLMLPPVLITSHLTFSCLMLPVSLINNNNKKTYKIGTHLLHMGQTLLNPDDWLLNWCQM